MLIYTSPCNFPAKGGDEIGRLHPVSFSFKFFDCVAIKAKNLQTIHPSLGFKPFIDCCSRYSIARAASKLFSMFCAIVVDVIETQRINVFVISAVRAAYSSIRIMLDSRIFKPEPVLRFSFIVLLAVICNPLFIEFPVFLFYSWFASVFTLISIIFFFVFNSCHGLYL